MGCAVMTGLAQGEMFTTLEHTVPLARAVPPGLRLRAFGTVRHRGRSTAVAVGGLIGIEDGRLYATGSTTCLIMRPA